MKSINNVIRKPIITEKATWLKEKENKYVFEVNMSCNKIEIKRAVEELFKVSVTNVCTYKTHGKIRIYGKFRGKRPDCKRAVVQLEEGDTIEFFEGA